MLYYLYFNGGTRMKSLKNIGLVVVLALGASQAMMASETPVAQVVTVAPVITEVLQPVVEAVQPMVQKTVEAVVEKTAQVIKPGYFARMEQLAQRTLTKENMCRVARVSLDWLESFRSASVKSVSSLVGLIKKNPKTSAGIFAAGAVITGLFGLKKYLAKKKFKNSKDMYLSMADEITRSDKKKDEFRESQIKELQAKFNNNTISELEKERLKTLMNQPVKTVQVIKQESNFPKMTEEEKQKLGDFKSLLN